MENQNATKNGAVNGPQDDSTHITELDFGKLHVSVQRVFSDTSTETVVDKVRKLILQHAGDPQPVPSSDDAAPLHLPPDALKTEEPLLHLPPDPLEEQQDLSETQLAIAEEKREYVCDEGGASGEETTGNEKQNSELGYHEGLSCYEKPNQYEKA